MSKRRYKFKVTDIESLRHDHPFAVDITEIPARTELKANYPAIAMLLDRGVKVSGIILDGAVDDTPPPPSESHARR